MRRALPLTGILLAAILILVGCGGFNRNPIPPSPPISGGAAGTKPAAQKTPEDEPPKLGPPTGNICIGAQNRRVPVIMYHDIIAERGPESEWFDCTQKEFADQMQLIHDQHIQVISMQQLYDHLVNGKEVPRSSIVLTFDDNYQGFYDYAWPILKQYNFPAMMFVHTNFVGDTMHGRAKMTWDTLKELIKDPQFSIGSHTLNHPAEFKDLPETTQVKELVESKTKLETELGIKVPFFAYPEGNYDKRLFQKVRDAGYTMAVTVDHGMAEESPDILAVNRYIHTKLEKAIEDRDAANYGIPGYIFRDKVKDAPLEFKIVDSPSSKVYMITGGKPETVNSESREGVLDFVKRTKAQAGINGTFFAMADVASTDNRLVGPCKTHEMPSVLGDPDETRWEKLHNRPVLAWSDKELAIFAYEPWTQRDDASFRQFMPDVTDVMMGGVWLVHLGAPRPMDAQQIFGSKDAQDPRRRAFIGLMQDGRFVIGASKNSVSSWILAQILAKNGVMEAVLLDSGFSTSLVYGDYILASGHSNADHPSRPVPHAIVMRGQPKTPEKELRKLALNVEAVDKERKEAKAAAPKTPSPPSGRP